MYIPDELTEYYERYNGIKHTGLKVTAVLGDNRVIAIQPITLDGLLAWAVVNEGEGRKGERINFLSDFALIPLPLKTLFKDGNGIPLWCNSYFTPAGDIQDVEYFHKRAPEGYRTKSKKPDTFGVKSVTGRWADRRTPFPVTVTDSMTAYCYGDAEEIKRLLQYVTHIGKKTAEGFGIVKSWKVEADNITERDCIIRNGVLARNVPKTFPDIRVSIPAINLAWVPPYWAPQFYSEGWRYGTKVDA